jgi:acyl carrier protein
MTNLNNNEEQGTGMTNSDTTTEVAVQPTHEEIVAWCREYIARTLDVSIDKVDANAEFDALGFDSAAAVALVVDIGTWLDRDLEPAALFEYPTIASFADYLVRP